MRWPARGWARGALTALVVVAISVLACAHQWSSTASAQGPDTDARYFAETGFRIDNDRVWDYFTHRGGTRVFGLPTSRTFQFMGATTQFFQRQVVQVTATDVHALNILDDGFLPYTRMNGSTFPAAQASIISATPSAASSDFGSRIIDFVRATAPDTWEGLPVRFFQTFSSTVGYQDAFPAGGGSEDLVPLFDLEMWGAPTSAPARDVQNHDFVYQRFQRGIMHYDDECKCTEGLLLADYLKAIITGVNLPDDLAQQASQSPLFKQYDITTHSGPLRPSELSSSNLANAFRPSLDTAAAVPAPPVAAPVPSAPEAVVSVPTATSTPNTAVAAPGITPTATPESSSPSSSASSTTQTSPLGDLTLFRTITQDTLDKLDAGDQRGATTRIRDLETEWDKAEARLKPKDTAEWTKIDDTIDEALRQLRSVKPDPAKEKTALQELLGVLK